MSPEILYFVIYQIPLSEHRSLVVGLTPAIALLSKFFLVITLSSNILTNNELYELLEIIHKLIFINDNDQFRELALSLKELVEYNFILFGLPEPNSDKPQAIADLNINYPQEWVDLYQKKEFWRIDPVVLATREKCTPQHWTDIYRKFPPDKNFIGLAHDFGLKDGWSCLIKDGSSYPWTIISIGGNYKKYRSLKKRTQYILERLSPHFHKALASLAAKGESRKMQNRLTKRELEVLKWLARGKTSWEIAIILNVTEATINFHVKNINAKLNTVNRSHAVAVARQWLEVS